MPTSFSTQEIKDANDFLDDYLRKTLTASSSEIAGLRNRLNVLFWGMLVLTVIMFAVGLVLIAEPFLRSSEQELTATPLFWVQPVVGGADLIILLLARPIDRLRKLMGDTSQITIALNSHRQSVALILIAMDINNKATVAESAEKISSMAAKTMTSIRQYFETP